MTAANNPKVGCEKLHFGARESSTLSYVDVINKMKFKDGEDEQEY